MLLTPATRTRAFLETVWPSWHAERNTSPTILSTGTCGRSNLFLQRVLSEDYAIAATWTTGCPEDEHGRPFPAGFRTAEGWQGHSWVEVDGFIIDITADQFGLDPVVILPVTDSRYPRSADLSYPESKQRRAATVEALWPQWRSY